MPELPEVEVTRRRIEPFLVGRTVAKVRTGPPSYFFLTDPASLRRRMRGRTFGSIQRRGKYLLARAEDGSRLVLHLGMSGQLFPEGTSSLRLLSATARASLKPEEQLSFAGDRHTHLRVEFADEGPDLLFRDVRKFGKVFWLAAGADHSRLRKLGPDALMCEGNHLFAASRGRQAALKQMLLDQSIVAGIGNIYADESLHLAGIRPTRRARRMRRRECDGLAQAVREVLERAIATGGSSMSDFVAPDGEDGRYQTEWRVYARAGQPCYHCGSRIRRIVVGQRGTHYCPSCQD